MRFLLVGAVAMCGTLNCRAQTSQPTPASASTTDKPRTWEVRVPPQSSPPRLKIEPEAFEAGDLKPGEKRTAEFRLTNMSDARMQLGEVRSTCWCAAGKVSDRTLEPGETATMEATLEAPPDPGLVDRAIYVFVDGFAQPAAIALRADVNYGIRFRIEYDSPESCRLGIIHLESVDGRPFHVMSANFAPPVYVDGFDPAKHPVLASYAIRHDLSAVPPGMLPKWFIVETDHPESPVIDLPIVPEDEEERRLRSWIFSASRILLGHVHDGATHDFVVTMRGLRDDPLNILEELRTEPSEIPVILIGLEAVEEGLRARFRVAPPVGADGLIYARLIVRAKGNEEMLYLLGRTGPTGQ